MNEDLFATIYNNIPSFIDSIDNVVDGVTGTNGAYAEQASAFLSRCLEIFPGIIRSYSDDRLLRYSGDIEYWSNLLNKIIQTFKETDRYKIIDVLYFETKQSILEYKDLLEKMELV
ncbi:MAG: hypothetical protein Q4D29_12760 [Lachnospiraceae bacterium]|nr:hypothetical protein [Lachnospiraceae bacterium]